MFSSHVRRSPALSSSESVRTESSEAAFGATSQEQDKEDSEQTVDDELEGLLHPDLVPENINLWCLQFSCTLRDMCSSHLDWEFASLRSEGGHHR